MQNKDNYEKMSQEFKQISNFVTCDEERRMHLREFLKDRTPEQVLDVACEHKDIAFLNFLLKNTWKILETKPGVYDYTHHQDGYERVIAKYLTDKQKDKINLLRSTDWEDIIGKVAIEFFVGDRDLYRHTRESQ